VLKKIRIEFSRARRMRFTTWRIMSYATSILLAVLLLHYQVHVRI